MLLVHFVAPLPCLRQCRFQRVGGTEFCGNHRKSQPHGTIKQEGNEKESEGESRAAEQEDKEEQFEAESKLAEQEGKEEQPLQKRPRVGKLGSEVLEKVKATCVAGPDSACTQELIDFSSFCLENPELKDLPNIGNMVDTAHGPVYTTEIAAQAYLSALKEQNGLKAATLTGHFKLLKEGLRAANLLANQLPAWAAQRATKTPLIEKLVRESVVNEAKAAPAACEKGFLTPEQVEEYALHVICMHKAGKLNHDIRELTTALYLRVQAARSHRAVDLFEAKMSDAGWSACGADAGAQTAFINITTLKPLVGKTADQAVGTKLKHEFKIVDPITLYLYNAWWDWLPADVRSNADCYLFPFMGKEGFEYGKKLTHAMANKFVLKCAQHLGIVHDPRHAASFTTKSVRQGKAATSFSILKEHLATTNPMVGRAQDSKMDLSTYLPKGCLVEPGPLYASTATAEAKLQSALEAYFTPLKKKLLCTVCGYPNCACEKCSSTGSKRLGHTCWLTSYKGKGKRSRNWVHETEAEFACRLKAWQDLGVQDVPVFEAGSFTF